MRDNKQVRKLTNQLVAMDSISRAVMVRFNARPLALATILSLFLLLLPSLSLVDCQDFEDLTNTNNRQPGANQFQSQQSNIHTRQSQQQQIINAKSMMRPVLSSRFAPSATGAGGQQQLLAQASQSSATVLAASTGSQAPQQQQPSVSNIEQLMKNALARTAQTNSVAASAPAESRQDLSPPPAEVQSTSRSGPAQQAVQQPSAKLQLSRQAEQDSDKNAEPSETTADTQPSQADDGDKQTTAAQTTTTSGHETVYSEQRFANLFARRGSNKKTRITPMEQIKAKPTLPSFIKSLPDPKQFSSSQSASPDTRPVAPPSGSAFASQKIQQQNQGRLNQQKKPIITSTSAANANNKRANAALGVKPQNPTAGPKAAASAPKISTAVANKPTPSSNNPFNRAQGSTDQANVIAMARKRLLSNNALESAKLKQQQQAKPSV